MVGADKAEVAGVDIVEQSLLLVFRYVMSASRRHVHRS